MVETHTFTNNDGNQLTWVTEGGSTYAYTYDDAGALIEDEWAGVAHVPGPDGQPDLLADLDTGDLLHSFVRDAWGMPVGRIDGSGTDRQHIWGNPGGDWPLAGYDKLGDPVAWVAAEGFLVAKYTGGAMVPMASNATGSLVMAGARARCGRRRDPAPSGSGGDASPLHTHCARGKSRANASPPGSARARPAVSARSQVGGVEGGMRFRRTCRGAHAFGRDLLAGHVAPADGDLLSGPGTRRCRRCRRPRR